MSVQGEFSSFKHLLKQVYCAHSSKVKELENEVKLLKAKLAENERKTDSSVLDCKRCIELEEAFKACKKALNEQSKWFENFGQKFSIFNSTELENPDSKNGTKLSNHTQDGSKISRCFSSKSFYNKNESSVKEQENDIDLKDTNSAEKLSIISRNQNLFKRVMGEDRESLDAYTVTFNQNLKQGNFDIKSDSMILVPDSLSTALDRKKVDKEHLNEQSINENKSKKLLKSDENESPKNPENNSPKPKVTRKRLSSETFTEDKVKRGNKSNLSENSLEMSRMRQKDSTINLPQIAVTCEPPQISNNLDDKTMAELSMNTNLISKKKNTVSETAMSEDKNETPKNTTLTNKSVNGVRDKNTSYQISPSLLNTQVNLLPKIISLEPISNDDDFQEQIPSSKSACNEDSWDISDRKKSQRKNQSIKCIKSTSKYKMTLDAPPLNYKKRTYKQTKLSKSIFQSKTSKSNKKSLQNSAVSKDNCSSLIVEDDLPLVLQDCLQTSNSGDAIKYPTVVDIDATFIPENFKLESPQYITTNVKKNTAEKSNLKNGSLFSNISFPEGQKSSAEDSPVNDDEIENSSLEDIDLKENMDSFDRLPLPEEPNYKYKNDVVRKKAERRQLNGFGCKECDKYYSELGLTDKEKKERMKKCSRHRGKFSPPQTPDHFWELDFPNTEECKARGYLNETQKVKLNNICNI